MAKKEESKVSENLEQKYLSNKIYLLKPLPRRGAMITDKNHIGYFMYEGAAISVTVPRDLTGGGLKDIFTSREEREFFEDALGVERNKMNCKADNNYFYGKTVRIVKDAALMEEGRKFDMSRPDQALEVKILLTSPVVAANPEEAKKKPGEYKFMFVDESVEAHKVEDIYNKKREGYKWLAQNEDNFEQLYEFLYIYWLRSPRGNAPDKKSSLAFLRKEVNKIVEDDLNTMLSIITSPTYSTEVLVHKAIELGIIKRKNKKFSIKDSAIIFDSLDSVVKHINNAKNQELKLEIEAKIEQE